MLDDWDDARLALAIARAGSLNAAARELGVHVSTVSRRLEALEESLGTHLFDRTPDGAVATEALERMLPFAESMEQSAAGIARAMEGLETEVGGLVRIAAPPGVVNHFFEEVVASLLTQYPKLRIDVCGDTSYADLDRREADIAVRVRRPTSGDLTAVCIVDARASLVFGCEGGPLGRREFERARFVTYAPPLDHLPECAWIMTATSPEQIVFRTNSLTAQVQAARRGVGLVVLPQPFEAFEGLEVRRLSPALRRSLPALPPMSLYLVTHRALRHVPRVAATWDALRVAFKNFDVR